MPVNSFENYPMSWKPKKSELERPYYLSIAARLEKDILEGRLPENTRLPPQRELADFLDLNLSTVTRAYNLCELKGLLYAVTGKGTFVSPGISAQDTFLDNPRPVIEMGMIKPFYQCNQHILDAARLVLSRQDSVGLFEYGAPFGTERQVTAALKWLRHLGVNTAKDTVLLSAGAQNALSVALISLFRAGDHIGVDRFTYTNFKGLANFLQIRLIPIEIDSHGMSPDSLAQSCKNMGIKGIYLMPSCSNPTGILMPAARRHEVADIARRFHLLIIEDDIYSFLTPGGLPSFYSLLPEQTIHICSVSKSLSAGLRVAFLAFPACHREALTTGMLNINLKTVSINGEIIAELIESGTAFDIIRQKTTLARQRNQIFRSIFNLSKEDDLPRFFHWLPLPRRLTSEETEVLALKNGVHVLGSHRFAMESREKSAYIRVSLVSPDTEEDLRKGALILKRIFEESGVDFFV